MQRDDVHVMLSMWQLVWQYMKGSYILQAPHTRFGPVRAKQCLSKEGSQEHLQLLEYKSEQVAALCTAWKI